MLSVNELFSGIGAPRMALIDAGIDHQIVGISEIDKYAIKSYEAIYGPTRNYGDISKIDSLDYADLWTYGFPCQDITTAGKMEGIKEGTRSGLLLQVGRLLVEAKNRNELPKVLLMENVKALTSHRHIDDFNAWIEFLGGIGYDSRWEIINARSAGVPHNRERVIMVSVRKDIPFPEDAFLFQKKKEGRLADLLENDVPERYYVNPEKTLGFIDIVDGEIRAKQATKKGYDVAKIGDCINIAYPNSSTRRGRVGHGFAQTLTTSCSLTVVVEDGIRYMTPLETWRIMGFKDGAFRKAASVAKESQLYKQAGNSIVVPVLTAIFGQVFTKDGRVATEKERISFFELVKRLFGRKTA